MSLHIQTRRLSDLNGLWKALLRRGETWIRVILSLVLEGGEKNRLLWFLSLIDIFQTLSRSRPRGLFHLVIISHHDRNCRYLQGAECRRIGHWARNQLQQHGFQVSIKPLRRSVLRIIVVTQNTGGFPVRCEDEIKSARTLVMNHELSCGKFPIRKDNY